MICWSNRWLSFVYHVAILLSKKIWIVIIKLKDFVWFSSPLNHIFYILHQRHCVTTVITNWLIYCRRSAQFDKLLILLLILLSRYYIFKQATVKMNCYVITEMKDAYYLPLVSFPTITDCVSKKCESFSKILHCLNFGIYLLKLIPQDDYSPVSFFTSFPCFFLNNAHW